MRQQYASEHAARQEAPWALVSGKYCAFLWYIIQPLHHCCWCCTFRGTRLIFWGVCFSILNIKLVPGYGRRVSWKSPDAASKKDKGLYVWYDNLCEDTSYTSIYMPGTYDTGHRQEKTHMKLFACDRCFAVPRQRSSHHQQSFPWKYILLNTMDGWIDGWMHGCMDG